MRFTPDAPPAPAPAPPAAVKTPRPKKANARPARTSDSESPSLAAKLSDAMLAALLPCTPGDTATIAQARTAFAAYCTAHPTHKDVRAAWLAFKTELAATVPPQPLEVAFPAEAPAENVLVQGSKGEKEQGSEDKAPLPLCPPAPLPSPKSYAPEVIADNSGKWCGNSLRFATEAEAEANVKALMNRWFEVRETRVVPSDDPVNYRWVDGRLEAVEEPKPVQTPEPIPQVSEDESPLPALPTCPPAAPPTFNWRDRYAKAA